MDRNYIFLQFPGGFYLLGERQLKDLGGGGSRGVGGLRVPRVTQQKLSILKKKGGNCFSGRGVTIIFGRESPTPQTGLLETLGLVLSEGLSK